MVASFRKHRRLFELGVQAGISEQKNEKKSFNCTKFCIFAFGTEYTNMKQETLDQVGNTPFSPIVLASLFPKTKQINDKARYLEKEGRIIRLKRGLYVRSADDGAIPLPLLIANHLYGPSYVSLQTALRHFGLIPERVYEIQSMTIKHGRSFDTPLGRFSYTSCGVDYFPIGIQQGHKGEDAYLIATPEKALCDLLLKTAGLSITNVNKMGAFLESDLRFDMEALRNFDIHLLERCGQKAQKKKETISCLIKLIKDARPV